MLGETYVSVHPQDGGGNGFVLRGTELASVAWTVSPVPEPAEYAMLAGGLIFAGFTRRRRRRGRAPAAC
ncbi:PEP-CTERM sorting domain-containing protein [Massilia sp. WF1]|uniref:PEP-CTERM sorting domain-containing protein n=1 Tax=unclassified Massilia TaxID=2609279 RepID=UPI0013A5B5E9